MRQGTNRHKITCLHVILCLWIPLKHERIANVFVDFGSAKREKIDGGLICRATHKIRIGKKLRKGKDCGGRSKK